ncbi:MAG: dioxygenase [Myxococcales bacterium]|nr:dioxygenase [Myxococcales bacterium]
MIDESPRFPPLFVSHGAPALALDSVRGAELTAWAESLPRPRSILVVSAHWSEPVLTRGTTRAHPPLLHDFDGYSGEAAPRDLTRVRYAAPGAPELASDLADLARVARSHRGWDHGVWAPLVHMFPQADIPVLQLSLVDGATPRHLYRIGQLLSRLALRGCLVLGSGGFTHNLDEIDGQRQAPTPTWAKEFDAWAANLVSDAEMDQLFAYRSAEHALLAHPTPEHLAPLFVVAGVASRFPHGVGFPIRGFEHGSLSRRCVQFGR